MEVEKNEKNIKLGLNIAYYRKLKGLSQDQLSELIGISRTHMSRIENADSAPSVKVLFEISSKLGIPEEKLFEFKD